MGQTAEAAPSTLALVRITSRATFSAAHRLHDDTHDPERNREVWASATTRAATATRTSWR